MNRTAISLVALFALAGLGVAQAFDEITFETKTPVGSDTLTRTLSLKQDGSARLVQSYALRKVMIRPLTLKIDAHRVREIGYRVEAALMRDLPPQLPTLAGKRETFRLSVSSQDPLHSGATEGITRHYGSFRYRMEWFVDHLLSVRDSVSQDGTYTGDFRGRVRLTADGIVLQTPKERFALSGEFAETLRRFANKAVHLSGEASGSGDLTVTQILSPKREQVVGAVDLSGAEPQLLTHAQSVPLEGSVRRALTLAGPNRVTVTGWVFTHPSTQALESIVLESVQARITQHSTVSVYGQIQGLVQAGDVVEVTGLSNSKRYARVISGDLEGWMLAERFEVGEPVLAAPTGPGLAGALGQ